VTFPGTSSSTLTAAAASAGTAACTSLHSRAAAQQLFSLVLQTFEQSAAAAAKSSNSSALCNSSKAPVLDRFQQQDAQQGDLNLIPYSCRQSLLLLLLQDWVGQPYGSRVHCRPPGRGWVYLLAPTTELWTQVGLTKYAVFLGVNDVAATVI
jgi:hypothetical protein